ncbi:MAG: hypothetical protein HY042_04710, partial [Spirochaetia bacterium]|nr:hypothetical protein [Spirochaetia bacterium]
MRVFIHNSQRIRAWAFMAACAVSTALPGALQAQITCTGSACALLPMSPAQLDPMFQALKTQYTDPLFNQMAEASVLASLSGPPVGTVNLSGVTAGAQVSAGYVPVTKTDINIPNAGVYTGVPMAGGAISPRAFFGFNAGFLFASAYEPSSGRQTPSFLSPARFDIYISAVKDAETLKKNSTAGGTTTAAVNGRGFEVRYHLVEGNGILLGPMLAFRGVSVGAGAYHSHMDVDFTQSDNKLKYQASGYGTLIWNGQNRISYTSQVDSYPIDIKTGIQFLYFLNLTIGVGTVWDKAATSFVLSRTGPVYAQSDLAQAMGYELPTAVLAAKIVGNGSAPARMPFA